MQTTAEPVFWSPKWQPGAAGQTARRITIACSTPGASIVYRITGNGEAQPKWRLYTKSLWLTPGRTLHAKSCRIGFKDSKEVRLKFDDEISTTKRPKTSPEDPNHWRIKLDLTDQLERLRKIKDLDRQGRDAIPQYYQTLKDEYASVRYWAVVGLHYNCKDSVEKEKAKAMITKMLNDPAVVVRIAAAHTLCDWGSETTALPVLADALKDKTDKARLFAMIALKKIGVKARPLLPQIKAALKDSDGYVQRVARATVKQLENMSL
jgi:hypothetical protein